MSGKDDAKDAIEKSVINTGLIETAVKLQKAGKEINYMSGKK